MGKMWLSCLLFKITSWNFRWWLTLPLSIQCIYDLIGPSVCLSHSLKDKFHDWTNSLSEHLLNNSFCQSIIFVLRYIWMLLSLLEYIYILCINSEQHTVSGIVTHFCRTLFRGNRISKCIIYNFHAFLPIIKKNWYDFT